MSPSSGDALVCCVKKGRYQRLHGITLVPPNNNTTAWFYEVVGQALVFWLPSVRLQFTTTERALRNLAPIWPPVGLYWILPQPLARTTKLLCAFQPVLFPVVSDSPAPVRQRYLAGANEKGSYVASRLIGLDCSVRCSRAGFAHRPRFSPLFFSAKPEKNAFKTFGFRHVLEVSSGGVLRG